MAISISCILFVTHINNVPVIYFELLQPMQQPSKLKYVTGNHLAFGCFFYRNKPLRIRNNRNIWYISYPWIQPLSSRCAIPAATSVHIFTITFSSIWGFSDFRNDSSSPPKWGVLIFKNYKISVIVILIIITFCTVSDRQTDNKEIIWNIC